MKIAALFLTSLAAGAAASPIDLTLADGTRVHIEDAACGPTPVCNAGSARLLGGAGRATRYVSSITIATVSRSYALDVSDMIDPLFGPARTNFSGFCYDDRYSRYRQRHHGRSAAGLEGQHFIACLQNHDQVGNRGAGERLCHLVDAGRAKLGAAVVLLGPFVPLLFQGEEWSASAPFQYFTDFTDATLQDNVRKGRRAEFAAFSWSEDCVPDPQDEATFHRSKLDWQERDAPEHADMLQWYRELIALRREERDFAAGPLDAQGVTCDADAGWLRFRRGRFHVVCNFSGTCQRLPAERENLRLASDAEARLSGGTLTLPPWSAAVLEPDESGVLP